MACLPTCRRRIFAAALLCVLAACGSNSDRTDLPDGQDQAAGGSAGDPASGSNSASQQAWRWTASNLEGYWCAWRPLEGHLEMGPSFPIEVRLAEARDGQPLDLPAGQIAVDARMPDHNHGMLQRVEIKALGPGHFRVDGMRLHMHGYWELYVDRTLGAITERAQFEIEL